MSSASQLSFACKGVLSFRPGERDHDAPVEGARADGDDDVAADALEDLAARDDEAVGVARERAGAQGALDGGVRQLLDRVGLAREPGLVALDVVPLQKDPVAGHDLAGPPRSSSAMSPTTTSWRII